MGVTGISVSPPSGGKKPAATKLPGPAPHQDCSQSSCTFPFLSAVTVLGKQEKLGLVSVSASTGKLPAGSACSDIHMALCAVNLAECAEEKIPPSTLVEIHLTAAMGLKTRCGGKLGFLAVSAFGSLLRTFHLHWASSPARS